MFVRLLMPVLPAWLALAAPGWAAAHTTLTSVVKAPVLSAAIGPSRAQIDVNAARGPMSAGSSTVVVRAPVIALATPFRSSRVVLGKR